MSGFPLGVRRWSVLLGLCLLLSCPSVAQPNTPDRAYAWALYQAFNSASVYSNPKIFQEAVERDPLMARRAFVSTLLYVNELSKASPHEVTSAIGFATYLAHQIGQSFQDPTPALLVQGIVQGRSPDVLLKELDEYAATLKAEGPSENTALLFDEYGGSAVRVSFLKEGEWPMIQPIVAKDARTRLALGFAEPSLSIQEIDTFPFVVEAFIAGVKEKDTSGSLGDLELRKSFSKHTATIASFRLAVYAEIGLFQEFETSLREVLASNPEPDFRASLLLSGFRLAVQRRSIDKAEGYLRGARAALGQPEFVSPALEYAVRTAEYQLRREKGFLPDKATKVAEFKKAWSALSNYEPLKKVQRDYFWFYGRRATSFWMSEFDSFESGGAEAVELVRNDLKAWLANAVAFDSFAVYDAADVLMQLDELTNSVFVRLAIADQALLVAEAFPEGFSSTTLQSEIVSPVESMVKEIAGLPHRLEIDKVQPGFPPFDLTQGGLYVELLGRARYLSSRAPGLTGARRGVLLTEALALIEKSGLPDVELHYLLSIGQDLQDGGDFQRATAAWERAFQLAQSLGYAEQAIDASVRLAKTYFGLKNWAKASEWAERSSAEIASSLPLYAGSLETGEALTVLSAEMTDVSIQAAVKNDDPSKAMAALNSGKEAQSAAVQMSGQKEAQAAAVEVQKQKENVAALGEQVKKLEALPASATRDELLEKTQKLVADTKADFLLRSRELRQKYPDLYSRVLKFDPLDLPDVQKSLPQEAAVIQYFPTADILYIFLVTRDTFRLRSIPIKEETLDGLAASFLRGIRRNVPGDAKLHKESQELYDVLIKPCAEDVEGRSILVFLPTGRLNVVPFACLEDADGVPLIDKKLVLELAKPTDFLRISQTIPKKIDTVVTFANATGDLPAAAVEGKKIAELFPGSKLFEGEQASKKNFFKYGGEAQVLHLATHGESNMDNSLANYLAMSDNEKVGQEEIFALGLEKTSIVTLSACNTAMGDSLDSKFVASLAEAFWIGGSQSVIASLWSVDDASTAVLMTELYQGLQEGKGRALALKDAQLKVKAIPGYEHPYYWAGFLLFGDWR